MFICFAKWFRGLLCLVWISLAVLAWLYRSNVIRRAFIKSEFLSIRTVSRLSAGCIGCGILFLSAWKFECWLGSLMGKAVWLPNNFFNLHKVIVKCFIVDTIADGSIIDFILVKILPLHLYNLYYYFTAILYLVNPKYSF